MLGQETAVTQVRETPSTRRPRSGPMPVPESCDAATPVAPRTAPLVLLAVAVVLAVLFVLTPSVSAQSDLEGRLATVSTGRGPGSRSTRSIAAGRSSSTTRVP